MTIILGYLWLHLHNPSINWATHKLTFWPQSESDPPIDAVHSTLPGPHPELSEPTESLALPVPSLMLLSDPSPSDKLQATTASISISFVKASALGLLSCLPPSHPQAILCMGIIEPPTCNTCSALPEPDMLDLDPVLASEYTSLHPQIPKPLHPYLDAFSKQKAITLLPCCPYDHSIDLEDGTSPPFGPIYSLSKVEQLALHNFLDKNLANEFIHPSQSSTGAPILFIKKKDGSLHLAMDYHSLNHITKKDCYPLPLIPNLLSQLHTTHLFMKIDLCSAYNLVYIAEGDKWKTAFQTHYGSYEFQVMHYGLTNAPVSFQCFMNDIFKDLLDICIVVYLDDILIYSENPDNHTTHVIEVLCQLCANNLYAKVEKCEFNITMTEFLGFIISPDSLCMDESKIQVIQDWPCPQESQRYSVFPWVH